MQTRKNPPNQPPEAGQPEASSTSTSLAFASRPLQRLSASAQFALQGKKAGEEVRRSGEREGGLEILPTNARTKIDLLFSMNQRSHLSATLRSEDLSASLLAGAGSSLSGGRRASNQPTHNHSPPPPPNHKHTLLVGALGALGFLLRRAPRRAARRAAARALCIGGALFPRACACAGGWTRKMRWLAASDLAASDPTPAHPMTYYTTPPSVDPERR